MILHLPHARHVCRLTADSKWVVTPQKSFGSRHRSPQGKCGMGIIWVRGRKQECMHSYYTEGLQCLIKIAEKFPSNLPKHLEKSHSEAFKELEKKEEKKQRECRSEKAKKSKSPMSPQSIDALFSNRKPYDNGSTHFRRISRKLSILIGTSNVPNSLVSL